MGKIVTFWSPYNGKSKTTSSMCAIAAQFNLLYPELEAAISHTGLRDISLEEKMDERTGKIQERRELYKRTGITALRVNYRQGELTSEKIRRSAIHLRMKSLFLYPNVENKQDDFSFLLLSETLKREYDMVFLDLESGEGAESLKYLKASDFVVIVLPQNPNYLERFLDENDVGLEEIKTGIIIGGYIRTAKYGQSVLKRKNDLRKKHAFLGVIPWNGGFFDAMTDGRVSDFFYRNQRVRRNEENYEFMVQTKRAAENIRKALFSS